MSASSGYHPTGQPIAAAIQTVIFALKEIHDVSYNVAYLKEDY